MIGVPNEDGATTRASDFKGGEGARIAAAPRPATPFGVLERWGGALLSPRAALAATPPMRGRLDAVAMFALYTLGCGVPTLADGLASALALGLTAGGFTLVGAAARVLLAPVLVMVVVEGILGNGRGHRRGFFLVPFVAIAVLGHRLELLGVPLGRMLGGGLLGALWPEVLGGLTSIGAAWGLRTDVEPIPAPSTAIPSRAGEGR